MTEEISTEPTLTMKPECLGHGIAEISIALRDVQSGMFHDLPSEFAVLVLSSYLKDQSEVEQTHRTIGLGRLEMFLTFKSCVEVMSNQGAMISYNVRFAYSGVFCADNTSREYLDQCGELLLLLMEDAAVGYRLQLISDYGLAARTSQGASPSA